MKDKEIFDGFNITLVKKAKGHESYSAAEEVVGKSVRNPTKNTEDVEKRSKAFYENVTEIAHALFRELVHCIEKGLGPNSPKVQRIIKKHHAFADQIQTQPKKYTRRWLSFIKSIQNLENNWTHSIQNLLSLCREG
jgi:hypothetical protein